MTVFVIKQPQDRHYHNVSLGLNWFITLESKIYKKYICEDSSLKNMMMDKLIMIAQYEWILRKAIADDRIKQIVN